MCIRMSAYLYLHNHLYLFANFIAFLWDNEPSVTAERAFVRGLFSAHFRNGPFRELSKWTKNVTNNHRTTTERPKCHDGDSELRVLRWGLCCISLLHATSAIKVTGNNRTHTGNRIRCSSCTCTCTAPCPLSNT